MKSTILTAVFGLAALLSVPATATAQSARGAARVDFDDQLIQGQVNKGAVHLIERKDSDLGSLVKVRKNYRSEILAGTSAERTPAAPAVMAIPVSLPVVKQAELTGATVVPPASATAAASSASVPAPAVKAAVKAKSVTPAVKSKSAKKPAAAAKKQKNTKLGGDRAISRR